MTAPAHLLEIEHVSKVFHSGSLLRRKAVPAVRDVSLHVDAAETFGLVGESGSGKSTLGRTATRLLDATSGTIRFDGTDVTELSGRAMRRQRRHMQMVFQDPYASLNPRMTVGQLLTEPYRLHGLHTPVERRERAAATLQEVGLSADTLDRHPHAFSGGQRQRVAIARALALEPQLIVADEPVSALDVSVQAQVLNLLRDLQERRGISFLFISHDLSVVELVSHRIGVMYLGELVETGTRAEIYEDPLHPYTRALLAAAPDVARRTTPQAPLSGEIPDVSRPPPGCPFHTRCPDRMPVCEQVTPRQLDLGGRTVACHLHDPEAASSLSGEGGGGDAASGGGCGDEP